MAGGNVEPASAGPWACFALLNLTHKTLAAAWRYVCQEWLAFWWQFYPVGYYYIMIGFRNGYGGSCSASSPL